MTIAPHAPRRRDGWPSAARCGARRRYDGCPASSPAMTNGRCRLHGGKSTGETLEGAERARQAALRHGFYTAEAKAERQIARAALVGLRAALAGDGL